MAKHRNGELGNIPIYMLGKIVRFVDDDYIIEHSIKPDAEVQSKPQYDDNIELSGGEEQVDTILGLDEEEE